MDDRTSSRCTGTHRNTREGQFRGCREGGGEAGNHTREAGRQGGEAKREGQERESQEGREIGKQMKAEGCRRGS